RLDEAAGNRQPETGPGANLIALGGTVKLLEHKLDLLGRDATALIDDLQLDRFPLLPAFDADRRLGGRIFGGVVEEIEQHLLEQDGIELEHWQAAGNLDLHRVPRQNFARALKHGADNLADVVTRHVGLDRAGLELGHVEQIGDKAVEPLRLVEDGGDEIDLGLVVELKRQILERPGSANDRGQRGLQVVGNGGEKGGAQAIRFLPALGPVQIVDEVDTLNGKSRLIDEGIKQAALVRGEQRS